MKFIPLSKGYFAMVDDADYEVVSKFRWNAYIGHGTVYAQRRVIKENGRETQQLMHRFIMGISDPKIQVDHIKHDGLDNRRENLRVATNSQNMRNQRIPSNNTSGYKGVSFSKKAGKFVVYYSIRGIKIHLGYFDCRHEAARHYNRAAKEHGEGFELLNDVSPIFPTIEYVTDKSKMAKNTIERRAKYFSDLKNGLYQDRYPGVSFHKSAAKWAVILAGRYIGIYTERSQAIEAYLAEIERQKSVKWAQQQQ